MYCGREGDRHLLWRWFSCSCGRVHYFCNFCYRDFVGRKLIVKRGQRGGGKKEFLKACPSGELRVADVLMGRPRFKIEWESKWL